MGTIAETFGGRVAPQALFPQLAQLLHRIKEVYSPLQVVLYGSRARGEATEQSDWDLKVILPDDAPDRLLSPIFGWRVQEGTGVYADVTCTRLSDFQNDLEVANSAARNMVVEGIVIDVA